MRTEKKLALVVLVVTMSLLSLPLGFSVTRKNGGGPIQAMSVIPTHSLYAASNPTGSCASLGLKTGAVGYAQLTHGSILVTVQTASPNSLLNVTVIRLGNGESDKSWVCGAASKSVGTFTTSLSGAGQLFQKYKASAGQQYVVEILDSNGNVLYATHVIAM